MGSAYVFTGTGDQWSQTAKLLSDGEGTTDTFGRSVALSGNGALALVGAHRDQNGAGTDTGAAYVFTRSAGSWERTDRLLAADGSRVDSFGRTVALSADASTALLGATGDDTAGSAAGAAYLFTGPGTGGSPFEGAVPGSGGSAPPNDLDADGLYEDVDGDGRATFADAIALAFVDASALTPEQTAALDFDGDGDVDFADAIDLAFRV
jgi:PKD repeat protein